MIFLKYNLLIYRGSYSFKYSFNQIDSMILQVCHQILFSYLCTGDSSCKRRTAVVNFTLRFSLIANPYLFNDISIIFYWNQSISSLEIYQYNPFGVTKNPGHYLASWLLGTKFLRWSKASELPLHGLYFSIGVLVVRNQVTSVVTRRMWRSSELSLCIYLKTLFTWLRPLMTILHVPTWQILLAWLNVHGLYDMLNPPLEISPSRGMKARATIFFAVKTGMLIYL